MTEPSKEALCYCYTCERWYSDPDHRCEQWSSTTGPIPKKAIDALCAERVKEALGEVSDTATIAYMMAHADSAKMVRTLTAERDRLNAELERYKSVYDADSIASAALKEEP